MKHNDRNWIAILLLVLPASLRADESTEGRPVDARVLLQTTLGDLVLKLDATLAPKTVEHLYQLIEQKVYDGVGIVRVEKNFVVQVSEPVIERRSKLDLQQWTLANQTLPAEFSEKKHQKFTVGMARQDGDIHSAKASFYITLGPAPHLDGQYTIVGVVEHGYDVIAAISQVRIGANNRPTTPLFIEQATIRSASEIDYSSLVSAAVTPTLSTSVATVLAWGIAFMMVISGLSIALMRVGGIKLQVCLAMINLLVGFVFLLTVLLPIGQQWQQQWLAGGLFISLLALIRFFGRFESLPAPPPK